MNITKISLISVVAGVISYLSVGYFSPTISYADKEIQDYIQYSLMKGCKPVIDVCAENCGQLDLKQSVKTECMLVSIMRAEPQRVLNNYLKLAELNKIKVKDLTKLPYELRAKWTKDKLVVLSIKESLEK